MALQRINWTQIDSANVPSGATVNLGSLSTPIDGIYTEQIIDLRYGPWNDVTDANLNIPTERRQIGLTVGIQSGLTLSEYWYYSGITDTDLVLKTIGNEDCVCLSAESSPKIPPFLIEIYKI